MFVTKKVGNAKNQFTCFSVFRYSKPFGAHATSNVCIYFQQKPFYGHPVGDTEVTPLQKRQIIQKYWTPISSVFRYLKPFGAHATSNVYIQVYIYIYNNKSQFTATLQEIQRWLFYKKDRYSKNIGHVVFCFSIFSAVWLSRNLELFYIQVYIYNNSHITAKLQEIGR